ncbi:MAG: type II toxin-antitoxin system VapC family toxin [Anaeromyxobacteraceae bacterium]
MIILDTHAWLWFMSAPERLGRKVRQVLRSTRPRGVAAISCWEVAGLAARERIELDDAPVRWMEGSLETERIELLPLTPAVASVAAQLKGLRDPSDRLIVATALTHSAELVTADETVVRSGLVRTIW